MKIPIAKTAFTDAEFDNILKPLRTGWVVQGPFVREFETEFSAFTGAKHSIAVTSCTTALHLSLVALDIGYGDEVIVPAFTWVATANVVEAVGGVPVFVDIDRHTYNIDVNLIEKKISKKTRAIIPVHLFGLPADMKAVLQIALAHNLLVIEDAACGFAARLETRHVGTFGQVGCFSFHPRKAITTGEGGMITTDKDALAAKLRSMRDHGAAVSDHQRHLAGKPYGLPDFPYLGFNYRMTDIQASIGVTQMKRASEIVSIRRALALEYTKRLQGIDWLTPPVEPELVTHGYQAFVCLFEPEPITMQNVDHISLQRNRFMEYLQEHGIATRPGTHAVHSLSYYVNKYNTHPEDFPESYIADRCSIAFPLFPNLTPEEFEYIIKTIHEFPLT
jgi:dTDP-4-amino-4,6-dideoxygalactose transaminase